MNESSELYQIPVRKNSGAETSLREFEGKVLLIVNVASKCGLTPQYEALERIYERYCRQGFEILAFPANDFLSQEPGTNEEIARFCKVKFDIKFPIFEKIKVKGKNKHPLYRHLTEVRPAARTGSHSPLSLRLVSKATGLFSAKGEVSWNFEKFLINRQGEVVERFEPSVEPEDPILIEALEQVLRA